MMDFYRKFLIFAFLILSSCCCNESSDDIECIAGRQEKKLKAHFSGHNIADISTLISETRSISLGLKRAGMKKRANRFDSYVDVLMFGNNTLIESLDDVKKLVKGKNCSCMNLCGITNNLFCN